MYDNLNVYTCNYLDFRECSKGIELGKIYNDEPIYFNKNTNTVYLISAQVNH